MVSAGLLLCAVLGAGEPAPEQSGWFLRDQLAARYNPFGLFDEVRVGYRFAAPTGLGPYFARSSLSLAANGSVSPAFARAGASVDVQFEHWLNLTAIYEAGEAFPVLGLVQSFPSAAGADYSEANLARLAELPEGDPRRNYPAPFQQLIVGALPQVHLGRWILKSNTRFVFQQISLREGDRVFYDQNWEILFPNRGWIFVDDVDLLFQVRPGLRVGARYDITHAFFTKADFAPEDVQRSVPDTTQRVGPMVSYLFFEKPHALFNAPTVSLVVNWWVEHPYRAGELSSAAIPYVGAAFSFRSDL